METLWIDAVEFEDYGGFICETQFVREMGQPYLMADGVGNPTAPASVRFTVREAGMHRFFLRTKNWCVEHKPDGLIVDVDGIRSGHICSQMHVAGWYFEIAADFDLAPGEHTLKIFDTTGWYGRFAAVVITNDYDYTPSRELSRMKKERVAIKGAPGFTDYGHFDLLIAGGGVGSIAAAITAARYGLKTALVHDRPVLGGNGSDEANVTLEGAAHRGYHETGVVYELKNYRHAHNITWSKTFRIFTEAEENLTVFDNTLVSDVVMDGSRITGVRAVNTMTLDESAFSADLFVDGTGDAWLGYYAGAAYRIGREAKFQHNEAFAPDIADGNTMSGCAMRSRNNGGFGHGFCGYYAEETDHPVEYIPPAWAAKLPEGDELGRKPSNLGSGSWWLEMPNDYDDIFESEYVRDAQIRMGAGYYNWLKNSWEGREQVKNYRLVAFGTYNAKRESRRLIGDYIISENDFVEGKTFPDAVTFCGWNIDVHHVDGIFSGKGGLFTLNRKCPITPIPLRALYSKNIDNLMMVGRCISVTHIGLGPTRVMLTGGTMGAAVATAAHLCKKYGKLPRGLVSAHIDELQQLLLKDGMFIPGAVNHDPADLALSAAITADSAAEGCEPACVINGRTRKTDGEPYAWVSAAPAPQSITLTFDGEKTVRQVRVTSDIPFAEYTYGYRAMPVLRDLVTEFTVSLLTEDGWREVCHVTDNIHRLAMVDFAPTKASAVKLTVLKTLDSDRVVIPEIRIY
ncbi:MAG: FAD-dependent oxidoreductase [Ruminococcaceae bacterium]|nr:FAD-dependent oxidoreductase [Oscillospiraceae bacterium]